MAGINLLDIKPHQVSRDMRGYTVLFYGEPKSGKTTIRTKFPKHLLLRAEKGYNAIPGAMAQPINSWSEFRQILRQLKDPDVHERFESIILDTIDLMYDLCTKYICANAKNSSGGFGVDNISDIPYGRGFTMVAQEFDECLRSIVQMNYGLIMISHSTDKTFTDEQGHEFNKIVPTLDKRAKNIVSRMVDLYGYSRVVTDDQGNNITKLFLRGTPRYEAGSRFKYTPDYIDFNYQALVEAIGEAIDKQMAEDGTEYFTDRVNNLYVDTTEGLNFDDMMKEFNTLITGIVTKATDEEMQNFWQPRISQITDKYLGRGNKVGNMSREQTEALSLILVDLKDLIAAEA